MLDEMLVRIKATSMIKVRNSKLNMKKARPIAAFFTLTLICIATVGLAQETDEANAASDSYGDVTGHRYYTSPPFEVINYYAVETDEGLIVVDTGRLLSQARYALEELQKLDKPVLAILLTHPHSDHYGGLPAFVEAAGDVPIYASQTTRESIKTDSLGYIAARNELLGKDFPNQADIPLPTDIVTDGEELVLGGVRFIVRDFPANEAETTTTYYLPDQDVMFVGDLLNTGKHPGLFEGHSANWLGVLETLQADYPDLVKTYEGHGLSESPQDAISQQTEYIVLFRELVAEALEGDGEISDEEKVTIVAQVEASYPDHEASLLLPGLIEVNVNGIAEELIQETSQQ